MSWNYQNKYIYDNCSIWDLQQALMNGATTYDDIGGLIVNGDINKWAKYKPIIGRIGVNGNYETLSRERITDSDRADANQGLQIPFVPDTGRIEIIVNKICWNRSLVSTMPTIGQWDYQRPRGQATQGHPNEWFRFDDFVNWEHTPNNSQGYHQNAGQPFYIELSDYLEWQVGTRNLDKGYYLLNKAAQGTYLRVTLRDAQDDFRLNDFLPDDGGAAANSYRFVIWIVKEEQGGGFRTIPSNAPVYVSEPIKPAYTDPTSPYYGKRRWTHDIDIADFTLDNNQPTYYYIVGCVLRCDANGTPDTPASASDSSITDRIGILPPWTTRQKTRGQWPFCMFVEASNYVENNFQLANVGYGQGTGSTCTHQNGVWEIPASGTGELWIHCKYSKSRTVAYQYRAKTYTGQVPSGSSTLMLYLQKDDDTTKYWLTPSDASGAYYEHREYSAGEATVNQYSRSYYVYDPSSNAINVNTVQSGQYVSYTLYAVFGNNEPVIANRLTLYKRTS